MASKKVQDAVNAAIASWAVTKGSDGSYTINTGKNAGTVVSTNSAGKAVVTKPTSSSTSSNTNAGTITSGTSGTSGTKSTSSTTFTDPSVLNAQLLWQDTTKYWLTNKPAVWDTYGDRSGISSVTGPMDFSKWFETVNEFVYGAQASEKQKTDSSYLEKRNNTLANTLSQKGITEEKDVRAFLEMQPWFKNATETEKANTARAITARIGALSGTAGTEGSETWPMVTKEGLTAEELDAEKAGEREGYYRNGDGTYTEILGYDELVAAWYKDLIDRMSDAEKKRISNEWAQDMQDKVKYYLDSMRTKEQAEDKWTTQEELYNINRASSIIQAEQTLRNAQESYDNLKQNWQYLGNMGMPWTSSVKIQAIWDSIKEAQTTLWEIQKLTQLSLDAQEKQRELQVKEYNQQIDNLMYDLKRKVGDEITWALSQFTTAELEGQLDTIDGVTAFKRELLQKLDNSLSWITSGSLAQMQYITEQYNDIADKMYTYAENKNKVNQEMSAVKWYYIDMNGNPILNTKWEVIEVPQSAPLDPVFDKETGKLITFGYDANGNITANVQQVYNWTNSQNAQIISMLNYWASVSDILKAIPDADIATVEELAKKIKPSYWINWLTYTWQWPSYQATNNVAMANALAEMPTKWDGGQCAKYVNKDLRKLGVTKIFGNEDINTRRNYVNSFAPVEWAIAIFDYNHKSSDGINHWHVAIVTNVDYDKGTFDVIESNYPSGEKIGTRTWLSLKDAALQWFFDPSISPEQYNQAQAWLSWRDTATVWGNQGVKSLAWVSLDEKNTATQLETYAFAQRAWNSDELIRDLENNYNVVWAFNKADILKTPEQKQYETYVNEFVNSILRWESWAAIWETEFTADKKWAMERYFPQPWDTVETVKAKQQLRENYIENMMLQSWKTADWQLMVDIYRSNKLNNYATDGNRASDAMRTTNTVSEWGTFGNIMNKYWGQGTVSNIGSSVAGWGTVLF